MGTTIHDIAKYFLTGTYEKSVLAGRFDER